MLFEVQVGLWYTLCVVDSVIMKHVADTVPMTTWSRTYYNVRFPSERHNIGRLQKFAIKSKGTLLLQLARC